MRRRFPDPHRAARQEEAPDAQQASDARASAAQQREHLSAVFVLFAVSAFFDLAATAGAVASARSHV
eukprot:gene45217-56310_t